LHTQSHTQGENRFFEFPENSHGSTFFLFLKGFGSRFVKIAHTLHTHHTRPACVILPGPVAVVDVLKVVGIRGTGRHHPGHGAGTCNRIAGVMV
jgi:hypothetical protein